MVIPLINVVIPLPNMVIPLVKVVICWNFIAKLLKYMQIVTQCSLSFLLS
jgi:hypothetical protein